MTGSAARLLAQRRDLFSERRLAGGGGRYIRAHESFDDRELVPVGRRRTFMVLDAEMAKGVMTEKRKTPWWRIEDVLARTDLAGLLDELTPRTALSRRGRRWHCPVPDHDDVHPSVMVSVDMDGHERWRCWSGDEIHRGDALDLVILTKKMSPRDAIDWLAVRAGLEIDVPLPRPQRRPRVVPIGGPLDPAVGDYVGVCRRLLWDVQGGEVLAWLRSRGFSDAVLRANHAGADPGWESLARARGLPGGSSPAAVLPALDPTGKVSYVQARYLIPGDGPKFESPTVGLARNPRLAWCRSVGRPRENVLVVCEGIPDAWTAAQAGYQSVGLLGFQAPDVSVALQLADHVKRHRQSIVAIIPATLAGRVWGAKLMDLLTRRRQHLTLIEPPAAGSDLNAWALRDPAWHATLSRLQEASGF